MNDAIETIQRAGFTASIYYDISPSSPADWDSLGTLEYSTRNAGHGSPPTDFEVTCKECDGEGLAWGGPQRSKCAACDGSGCVLDGLQLCKDMHGATHCLPVYVWDDRNGTELRIAESWAEANGWIYTTQAQIDLLGVPLESVHAALESELQTWQQWAQGDVYAITVESPTGEMIDSCGGFYGFDYAMEEARGMLDIEAVRIIEANPGIENIIIN